jgi:hypothetical protein
MAATYKIIWKNHCTPQEQVNFSSGSRWYLDSDCGKKMTGTCETIVTTDRDYVSNLAVTDSASSVLNDENDDIFLYIKNTGGGSGDDVFVAIESSQYTIRLSSGESFASHMLGSSSIRVICDSGEDSTVEYFTGAT